TILSDVERIATARRHQPRHAVDAIVDVAERARLLAITPDVDLRCARELRRGDLAADRGRRLFASAAPRAERTEDVVEARNARLDRVVLAVVRAQPLRDQLLPAVGVLRLRRIRIVFLEGRRLG